MADFLSRNRKIIVIVLTVLAVVALVTVIAVSHFRDQHQARIQAEYNVAVERLESRRTELLSKYSSVESEEYAKIGCSSALAIIVKGANSMLYTDIFETMSCGNKETPDLTGIICLGPNELPGMDGNITEQQFRQMLDAGWDAAVYWDGEGDLDEYLNRMKFIFISLGVPEFDTLLFWDGSYSDEHNDTLIAHGIEYAVHDNSGSLPFVESRIKTEGGEPLLPGYIGWKNGEGKNSGYVLDYVLVRGGVTAFIVNFEGPDAAGVYTKDRTMNFTSDSADNFSRLVSNHLLIELDKGKLIVGSFDDAFEMRRTFLDKKEAAQPVIEAKKAQISAEISEIEKEIIEIYKKYTVD